MRRRAIHLAVFANHLIGNIKVSIQSIRIFFTLLLLSILFGCTGTGPNTKPDPTTTPTSEAELEKPNNNSRKPGRKKLIELLTDLVEPKPTDQRHLFNLSIVDINNNPIKNVTFGADIELLSSIENEKLIESKTINKISDNSGNIVFEITHPITQTTSAFSTYTFVSYTIIKDDYIDKSGSLDIYHSEEILTKYYLTEKILSEKITIFKASDFIDNSFNLYSKEAKITFSDLENCIETFILFPSSYGKLKIGSIKIIKEKEGLYLEFGFNSSIKLTETFKSVGRRLGPSLFTSNLKGVRMRNNRKTIFTSPLDNLDQLLKRENSDSEFLLKLIKG